MSKHILCPYCPAAQTAPDHGNYKPFYVNCSGCASRFIVEPVRNGTVVYKVEEVPCCSDPECRATEMAGSGQE